ncbi:hypothetical protein ACA910_005804 [Epithemia clementina (nom. ined.)]
MNDADTTKLPGAEGIAVSASSVKFLHHGAAASSHRGIIGWIQSPPVAAQNRLEQDCIAAAQSSWESCSTLVYASHSVLNLADANRVAVSPEISEPVWHVKETLCTATTGNDDGGPQHIITCIATVSPQHQQGGDGTKPTDSSPAMFTAAIVCGFADGTVSLWLRSESSQWCEIDFVHAESTSLPITCIDATWLEGRYTFMVMIGTSSGATLYQCKLKTCSSEEEAKQNNGKHVSLADFASKIIMENTAVCSVNFRQEASIGLLLALIGTAAPRHNKIHALQASMLGESETCDFRYSGSLMGHEDWISCMAWDENSSSSTASFLATGSQDARIRLWKFTSTKLNNIVMMMNTDQSQQLRPGYVPTPSDVEGTEELSEDDDDNTNHIIHEDEEDEGESRLDIYQNNNLTRVSLEALLVGHEEAVTSLCWYRHSKKFYKQDHLLISSSMDRSILLWAPGADGIWTPLTRVGGAGGILGGSVGSTLLGYLGATCEPNNGACLVGHAYGGALHVWNLDGNTNVESSLSSDSSLQNAMTTEELATSLYWRATPCVTGHFAGVTDLCWEASAGHYLLTVSEDQTCRLWAPVKSASTQDQSIWLELARPQVHGYNLVSVTSLSTQQHPHFIVTCADEKELRCFDAPKLSLEILESVTGMKWPTADPTKRVERAYIPSLGLSNKATASEGAEEDSPEEQVNSLQRLPLERDLGAVSLWPEVQKLFGHTTELYCVTSTLTARSIAGLCDAEGSAVLVASSCKARNEEAAAIRLWRAWEGKSHQVLSGGHKSTVATLAFSPDGTLLASSGKDRRLCLWQRQDNGEFKLAWAKDSAHKRIVWSVHFCPCGGDSASHMLASASRDGCVKIWSIKRIAESAPSQPVLEVTTIHSFAPARKINGKADSVTAVSFCPRYIRSGIAVLALGLESGHLELWNIPLGSQHSGVPPSINLAFPDNLCHKATVTKLAWRPSEITDEEPRGLILASCSSDHGCRIFEITP